MQLWNERSDLKSDFRFEFAVADNLLSVTFLFQNQGIVDWGLGLEVIREKLFPTRLLEHTHFDITLERKVGFPFGLQFSRVIDHAESESEVRIKILFR